MPVALVPYVMAVVLIGCFGMFRVILHWYITEVLSEVHMEFSGAWGRDYWKVWRRLPGLRGGPKGGAAVSAASSGSQV